MVSIQWVRQNAKEPRTLGIRPWSWKKNSISTGTSLAEDELKLRTPSASAKDRLKSGSKIGVWSGKRSTRWLQTYPLKYLRSYRITFLTTCMARPRHKQTRIFAMRGTIMCIQNISHWRPCKSPTALDLVCTDLWTRQLVFSIYHRLGCDIYRHDDIYEFFSLIGHQKHLYETPFVFSTFKARKR